MRTIILHVLDVTLLFSSVSKFLQKLDNHTSISCVEANKPVKTFQDSGPFELIYTLKQKYSNYHIYDNTAKNAQAGYMG